MNARRVTHVAGIVVLTASFLIAAGKPEQDAQKAAEQWLVLVDAGKFSASWKAAAPYFQRMVPQDKWELSGRRSRESFGNLISRKLQTAQYTKSVPGAPDGEYVVLRYDTSFTNKKTAVETVTPMRDKDGQWKVSGYFIK